MVLKENPFNRKRNFVHVQTFLPKTRVISGHFRSLAMIDICVRSDLYTHELHVVDGVGEKFWWSNRQVLIDIRDQEQCTKKVK